MSAASGPLLVLGIGNVLLGDDGVGVHVVHELERQAERGDIVLPRDTRPVDGGTLGLDLLPLLDEARAIVLVDAADLGAAAGTVTVLRSRALRTGGSGARSALPTGLGDLLTAARLADVLPAAVSLVAVEPREIAAGLNLSAAVRAALPAAVAATAGEAWRLDGGAAGPEARGQASEATGSAA